VSSRLPAGQRLLFSLVDYGEPASYLTLDEDCSVISSDGEEVGKVQHVLADEEEGVFDGIVIDTQLGPGGLLFVDAPQVKECRERAVVLSVPASEVEKLPKPAPNPSVMENHGVEDSESPLQAKLHRAWDLISGNT
jgi:sporulation protein YlmC with PRC-barrel domain